MSDPFKQVVLKENFNAELSFNFKDTYFGYLTPLQHAPLLVWSDGLIRDRILDWKRWELSQEMQHCGGVGRSCWITCRVYDTCATPVPGYFHLTCWTQISWIEAWWRWAACWWSVHTLPRAQMTWHGSRDSAAWQKNNQHTYQKNQLQSVSVITTSWSCQWQRSWTEVKALSD